MTSKNLYHRRLVAESAAKSCWICYKPSSTVLITPESDDWFHICVGHLSDRSFATAKDADDLAKKKREAELEAEIEAVKKEYAEKIQKKLDKKKKKDGEKEKEKEAEKEKAAEEALEKEQQDKIKQLENEKSGKAAKTAIDGPRVFELSKQFYQMRLQKKRDAEIAKRTRERLRTPGALPSAPSGDLR